MKKTNMQKLQLNRVKVRPLTIAELDIVAGGVSPNPNPQTASGADDANQCGTKG